MTDRDRQINQKMFTDCDFQQCNQPDTEERVFNTVYQNCHRYGGPFLTECAEARVRQITVAIKVTQNHQQGSAQAWITPDALKEPVNWIEVSRGYVEWWDNSVNLYDSFTFMVPLGWYYKVSYTVNAQLAAWCEWDIYPTNTVVLTGKDKPE